MKKVEIVLAIVESILNAHGLSPNCVVKQGDTLQFEVWGLNGNCKCWATLDGLIVGGEGELAGTLTQALVSVCYSIR